MQLGTRKANNPIKKWAEDLNRYFSKKDYKDNKCQINTGNFIIREMKIKTTMRYHLALVRTAIIKKSTNNKCRRVCGEKEPSYTTGGNVNRFNS